MFKKILYPTDGSDNSRKAMNYVIELSKQFNSEVLVLSCYMLTINDLNGFGYGPYGDNIPFYQNKEQQMNIEKQCHGVLNEVTTELITKGINARSLIENGDLSTIIINIIESEHCDLVIMASRGFGSIKSLLLGSVSNYVIHHTKCPVLLIH